MNRTSCSEHSRSSNVIPKKNTLSCLSSGEFPKLDIKHRKFIRTGFSLCNIMQYLLKLENSNSWETKPPLRRKLCCRFEGLNGMLIIWKNAPASIKHNVSINSGWVIKCKTEWQIFYQVFLSNFPLGNLFP